MPGLLRDQRAVTGWSEFGFGQLIIDGQSVPVLGLQRHLGSVEPPTTGGRPLSNDDQIEFGAVTLNDLGKKVGDTVRIGTGTLARTVIIVGTVTLPSFGVDLADHVSLGNGAMLPEATLLAVSGAHAQRTTAQATPVYPSAVAIDLAPGTTGAQRARLVSRIVSANPDGTPGGSYELPHALASTIINAQHLGGQPIALALALAAAAVLSLALAVLGLVRRRRGEFALLKALGMTQGQLRGVVAWQTTLTLLIAVAVGVPLGIIAGRIAWQGFAGSLGVVPVAEVPVLVLVLGLAGLVVAGNLLASVPAAIAARTRAGLFLRAE
jgi:predicted lysophospholipase L1 biosynthesis ABC-type transport system permease subunit